MRTALSPLVPSLSRRSALHAHMCALARTHDRLDEKKCHGRGLRAGSSILSSAAFRRHRESPPFTVKRDRERRGEERKREKLK